MACLVKTNEAIYVSVLSSCANLNEGGALLVERKFMDMLIEMRLS